MKVGVALEAEFVGAPTSAHSDFFSGKVGRSVKKLVEITENTAAVEGGGGGGSHTGRRRTEEEEGGPAAEKAVPHDDNKSYRKGREFFGDL